MTTKIHLAENGKVLDFKKSVYDKLNEYKENRIIMEKSTVQKNSINESADKLETFMEDNASQRKSLHDQVVNHRKQIQSLENSLTRKGVNKDTIHSQIDSHKSAILSLESRISKLLQMKEDYDDDDTSESESGYDDGSEVIDVGLTPDEEEEILREFDKEIDS